MPPKWNGEGVDSSGEVMDSPTSPLAPVSPGRFRLKRERRKGAVVGEDSRTTLVTSEDSGALDLPHPSTPLRRHHSKLSSLMNQRGSTRRNYYHHINSQDGRAFYVVTKCRSALMHKDSNWYCAFLVNHKVAVHSLLWFCTSTPN